MKKVENRLEKKRMEKSIRFFLESAFQPILGKDKKEMLTEKIDNEGVVEDLEVETYLATVEQVIMEDKYIRLIGDNGATDVEMRLSIEEIIGLLEEWYGVILRKHKEK